MALLLLCCTSVDAAQPELPFDIKQLGIGLPEAGAPRAVVGPYATTTETTMGTPALQVYRPRDLAVFPARDTLSMATLIKALDWAQAENSRAGSALAGKLDTAAAVAWLRWQLQGDRNSAAMFTGAACALCRDPNWTVQAKRL